MDQIFLHQFICWLAVQHLLFSTWKHFLLPNMTQLHIWCLRSQLKADIWFLLALSLFVDFSYLGKSKTKSTFKTCYAVFYSLSWIICCSWLCLALVIGNTKANTDHRNVNLCSDMNLTTNSLSCTHHEFRKMRGNKKWEQASLITLEILSWWRFRQKQEAELKIVLKRRTWCINRTTPWSKFKTSEF